jgi:hypothetical protein
MDERRSMAKCRQRRTLVRGRAGCRRQQSSDGWSWDQRLRMHVICCGLNNSAERLERSRARINILVRQGSMVSPRRVRSRGQTWLRALLGGPNGAQESASSLIHVCRHAHEPVGCSSLLRLSWSIKAEGRRILYVPYCTRDTYDWDALRYDPPGASIF